MSPQYSLQSRFGTISLRCYRKTKKGIILIIKNARNLAKSGMFKLLHFYISSLDNYKVNGFVRIFVLAE